MLVACNTLSADIPTVTASFDMTTDNREWVIIPKERAEQMELDSWLSLGADFEGYWTPTADDILNPEERLADYLRQNPEAFYRQPPVWERLDEYQRQYIGLMFKGDRIIYGNFFCDDTGMDWQQEFVIVLDGGDCFFQVKYDVKSGLFIGLQVNGEA
jgi:hypothetical protein